MKWTHDILRSPEEGDSGAGGSAGFDGGEAAGTAASAGATTLLGSQETGQTTPLGNEQSPQGGQKAPQGGSPVVSEPFYIGLYDKDGKLNKDRFDALPEHLKDSKGLFEKYDTFEAMLGGMRNLAQLAGKKGLEPLPEGAPEQLVKERKALLDRVNGVPEEPKGYGLEKPQDYPEDLPWNEERASKYSEIFHKYSAPPQMVQELMAAEIEAAKQEYAGIGERQQAMLAAEREKLQEAYGQNLQPVIDKAIRGLKSMGLTENGNPIDANHPIFNNAVAVQMAAKYAEAISEDRLVSGNTDSSMGMSDREKALDILNNPSNPLHAAYHDAEHPRHDEAVRVRQTLNKRYVERQRQ